MWNENPKQVEVLELLMKGGAEINALDEKGRTPLHYASESAKSEILPSLIKNGAMISLREPENNMTPYQLAPNEKIRQILIKYSTPPFKTKPEDIDYLNSALRDQHILMKVKGTNKKPPILSKKKPLPKAAPRQNTKQEVTVNTSKKQEFLLNTLKQIQEYGINSYQHAKKPYLFTGSWLEKVNSVEDLINDINSSTPSEAVLKVFNVLYPCERVVSVEKGDEKAVNRFYEERSMIEPELIGDKLAPLYVGGMERERYIKKLEADTKILKSQIENHKKNEPESLEEMKDEDVIVDNKVEELIKELQEAHKLIETLKEKVSKTNDKYLSLKNQIASNSNADLVTAKDRINELERELEKRKQEDIALRFKAGQAFLSSLETNKQPLEDIAEENPLDDFNPEDDYAIVRMSKALKKKSLNLLDELNKIEKDEVSLYEFSKFLESLELSPNDITTLIKIAETSQQKINNKEFADKCDTRAKQRKEWETKLLKRILEYFKEGGLELMDAFGFFDSNENGMIEYEEMAAAFNVMKIKLRRQDLKAIFTLFDKDMNGFISLEEFQDKLMQAYATKESETNGKVEHDIENQMEINSVVKDEEEEKNSEVEDIKEESKKVEKKGSKRKQLPGKSVLAFNADNGNSGTINKEEEEEYNEDFDNL